MVSYKRVLGVFFVENSLKTSLQILSYLMYEKHSDSSSFFGRNLPLCVAYHLATDNLFDVDKSSNDIEASHERGSPSQTQTVDPNRRPN